MKKDIIREVYTSALVANRELNSLSADQKTKLEKSWDIEHAYYSSSLEGSKIDRKEFEKIGCKLA